METMWKLCGDRVETAWRLVTGARSFSGLQRPDVIRVNAGQLLVLVSLRGTPRGPCWRIFVTRRSASRILILMMFMIFPAAGLSPSPFPAAESGRHVDAAAAVAGGAS